MKMIRLVFILSLFIFTAQSAYAYEAEIKEVKTSQAYKKFTRRPKNELSKLSYLIDRFQTMGIKVMYEGHEYDAPTAAGYAKKFLADKYKGKGDAAQWVNLHCYRSPHSNKLIEFRFNDGTSKPARDILLSELKVLNSLGASN